MKATTEKKQQLLMTAFAHETPGTVLPPKPGDYRFFVYCTEPYKSVETAVPSGVITRRFRANKVVRTLATQHHHQCKLIVRYNPPQEIVYVYYSEERYSLVSVEDMLRRVRALHQVLRDLTYTLVLDVEPSDVIHTEVNGGTSEQ